MRHARIERKTGETEIRLSLDIDGTGQIKVDTGIGFFDHMLTLFAKHGKFDLDIEVPRNDLAVDGHHLVEDVGIVLGQAFAKAAGDKRGIKRYGTMFLPMDETLTRTVIDLSGRPFLVFDASFRAPMVGGFDTELTVEFFRAFAFNAGATLHIAVLTPEGNAHHQIESMFKGLARALREALEHDPRESGVPSTKGVL